MGIQEKGGIEYVDKTDAAKVGVVGEMLTLADKSGRGGLDPPFLAEIICEQPLVKRESEIVSPDFCIISPIGDLISPIGAIIHILNLFY